MITAYSVLPQGVKHKVIFFKTDSEEITCDSEEITCDID